jgi:hypothetical protein
MVKIEMYIRLKLLCMTGLWVFFCTNLFAETPWWNPDWKYRAEILIETPKLNTSVDTSSVNLFTDGRSKPGGDDIRIVDIEGKEVPCKVISEKPEGFEVLFRVEGKNRELFHAYFGNILAEKPSYHWIPQTGELTLETRQKTDHRHPANLEQMVRGFNASSPVYKKGVRKKIDDSENPFGPNNYYYSYYRGHINCPIEGEYWFATNSDDASFLLIDGKPVIGWPLSHTKDGGVNKPLVNIWTRRNRINLHKGIHLIEYYQEEGVGSQMARAGWKKPGDEDFEIIPEEFFISSLNAVQNSFEEKDSTPYAFFRFTAVRNIRFKGLKEEFVTLKFINKTFSPEGKEIAYRWNFGDGTYSDKKEPEHTLVAGREYNISLTITDMDKKGKNKITIPVKIEKETIKAERFSLNMGVMSNKMVYDEREMAGIKYWVRNYTEKPITLSVSREVFTRSSEGLSNTTEAISLEPYKSRETSFSVSPEVSEIRLSLKYNGHTIIRKDIIFLEPMEKIPALNLSEGKIEDQHGKQVLIRTKSIPEKVSSYSGLKNNISRIVLVSSHGQNPPDGKTYCEQFVSSLVDRENNRLKIIPVRIEASIPYYSPLLALIKMNEILSQNPDMLLFVPGQNEINYMLEVNKEFKNLLSFFVTVLQTNNVQCMLIVPPAVPGKVEQSTSLAVAIKEVGLRQSILLLDLYSSLPDGKQKIGTYYRTANTLSSFPNVATQKFLAERLSEHIKKWISPR